MQYFLCLFKCYSQEKTWRSSFSIFCILITFRITIIYFLYSKVHFKKHNTSAFLIFLSFEKHDQTRFSWRTVEWFREDYDLWIKLQNANFFTSCSAYMAKHFLGVSELKFQKKLFLIFKKLALNSRNVKTRDFL